MKKILGCAVLMAASSSAFAVAPGGDGCGWGQLLFDGQSGPAPHVLAVTTNGTSGNNTFGMTTGTNGCDTSGKLNYGGKSLFASLMNEFSEDVAAGNGEAMTAVAVMMGVEPQDRQTFAEVTHQNFKVIFPSENTTADEAMNSLNEVMKSDARLAKYAI
ncbi:MAG: DUF3015 domain-containing protein [Gammaproteobacteria bacterium]|nr:MAG: DUF3015 domain-containing protein [Gammaproteobacteria bacterium]